MLGSITSLFCEAQTTDCNANFEVHAGPGIDICIGGTVNLDGIIGGDATRASWRGGKGQFIPNKSVLNPQYIPDTSEAGKTVILLLVASNPDMPNCPPVRDEIKIVVNEEVKADAGPTQRVCPGNMVQMHGSVKGMAKETKWITNGSGTFDNSHKLDGWYTPSDDDLQKGACSIMLAVLPFGICAPDTATMILEFEKSPAVVTETDITVDAGKSINLSATASDFSKVRWRTRGTGSFDDASKLITVYKPSAADIKSGKVMLTIIATSVNGKCTTEKDITINIRPKIAGK